MLANWLAQYWHRQTGRNQKQQARQQVQQYVQSQPQTKAVRWPGRGPLAKAITSLHASVMVKWCRFGLRYLRLGNFNWPGKTRRCRAEKLLFYVKLSVNKQGF